jgi:hypothetical protein
MGTYRIKTQGQQQGYGIMLFVICSKATTSSTIINHPPANVRIDRKGYV